MKNDEKRMKNVNDEKRMESWDKSCGHDALHNKAQQPSVYTSLSPDTITSSSSSSRRDVNRNVTLTGSAGLQCLADAWAKNAQWTLKKSKLSLVLHHLVSHGSLGLGMP